jgi:FkbM family methyltransferase
MGDEWEPAVRDFILRHAEGVCADVGAGTGVHSRTMASLPRVSEVHAFEPIPYNAEQIRGLKDPKIVVHPYALGRENGEMELCAESLTPTGFPWVNASKDYGRPLLGHGSSARIRVPVRRMRDVLGRVDFMKIDVEGMECDVLLGAEGVYEGAWLCVEAHAWADLDGLLRLLGRTHVLLNEFSPSSVLQHLFFRPMEKPF